ncbi:deacetylase, PIG-L family [Campylobacter mucosalis]|uniref:PIG-L deacetylase family protein n=1 Tax=Campylobacter mucosalis TaxID=202 RepID=UPI0015938E96|nr:PIG-L family deacetylase [Campylobacter mucosalis]QKF62363.1 deacetylase, PIG-L family [Campylobacter mucosalis]
MSKILAIAVHPDDETLGCGGTLLKHKANGDEIFWLICTDIPKTHNYHNQRESEIAQVAKMYEFDGVYRLGLDTMRVDEYSMSELVAKISAVINEIKPQVLYLPFYADVHSDHRKIFEATYSCTKSFRYPFIEKIYMIETLSETEFAPSIQNATFTPNVFVDISEFFDKKIDIIKIYKSELAPHPFPRSIESITALATLRGSTMGGGMSQSRKFAESFMLLKEIR